jgi:hypothetical protein
MIRCFKTNVITNKHVKILVRWKYITDENFPCRRHLYHLLPWRHRYVLGETTALMFRSGLAPKKITDCYLCASYAKYLSSGILTMLRQLYWLYCRTKWETVREFYAILGRKWSWPICRDYIDMWLAELTKTRAYFEQQLIWPTYSIQFHLASIIATGVTFGQVKLHTLYNIKHSIKLRVYYIIPYKKP